MELASYDEAIRDTIEEFEATGSPVITDGEQRKYHNFWTYPVHGLPNIGARRLQIPSPPGTHAGMPLLTAGPFRTGARRQVSQDGACATRRCR